MNGISVTMYLYCTKTGLNCYLEACFCYLNTLFVNKTIKNMADLHDLKQELKFLRRDTVLTVGMLIQMIEIAEEKEEKRTQDLDDAYWDTQSDTF